MGRDGERMRVTTMFGHEVPADRRCNTAALTIFCSADGPKRSLGFMLLAIGVPKAVVFSLTPASFILVLSQYFS